MCSHVSSMLERGVGSGKRAKPAAASSKSVNKSGKKGRTLKKPKESDDESLSAESDIWQDSDDDEVVKTISVASGMVFKFFLINT